ncbi:MAG: TonB-dependent receptor [Chitinophagales bacterium]
MKQLFYLFLTFMFAISAFGQQKTTLSGHITDAASGEELIGVNIYIKELGTGGVTNVYGFYSLTVPRGRYEITYSYIGYESIVETIDLEGSVTKNIELSTRGKELEEFVVTSEKKDKNVESTEMSTVNMKVESIKKLPALFGEVDIIKALQLLPGVQSAGEGTSGLYVRGGNVDQNLILLDEAPVYNASHLMGFFSVFNPDAIKDMQLYKGGIPAQYGGRLSSVLDIRMKEGNSKRVAVSGGIGTVSSRLTVEAPIAKGRGSFLVSGRRTYADIFLGLSSNPEIRENKLYFYDLNLKGNYRLGEKDRIFLSGYFGRDVFKFSDEFKMQWGNGTGTLRWNHIFSNKLFMNTSLIYSNFDYLLGDPAGVDAFEWTSDIQNQTGKVDFNYFLNPENTLKFGVHSTRYQFSPGHARSGTPDDGGIFNDIKLPDIFAWEHAAYLSNEHKITPRLKATYGLRFSAFQNVGKATVYSYDKSNPDNYTVMDSTHYDKGEVYKTHTAIEPRLALKYSLNDESSVKLSYNRTVQYVHLASNSTSASPLDIWFPSSTNVEPQRADQIAIGYFRNLKNNMFETSVEAYYKKMDNQIDFKDHAQLLLNEQLEGELRIGEGYAYGLEFMVRKQEGKLQGMLSYTLSRTERKIPEINNGKLYPNRYDRTHDVSLFATYDLSDKWTFGGNWVYTTGAAVTMPTGRFEYGNMITPVYSDRNAARLPAYHRLDLSATLRPKSKKKPNRKFKHEWVFSIYNTYFRKNAFSINFVQDEKNPNVTKAEKLYLFGIIPSITKNFKF